MVSQTKSRARSAAQEATLAPPPTKRIKPSPDRSVKSGFADILLDSKTRKPLAPAHTSKSKRSDVSKVSDKDAVIRSANGHGDVEVSKPRGHTTIEISSDESSSSDEDEDDNDDDDAGDTSGGGEQDVDGDVTMGAQANGELNGSLHEKPTDGPTRQPFTNGANVLLGQAPEDAMEEDGDDEEPTFAERLQSNGADPINVEMELANMGDSVDATHKPHSRAVTVPSAATFGTVLSQALRTNDKDLLESCFETNDLEGVRETITRLDSRYIITLLERIAERISKSPGRLGNLMVWVQWSIIAHGGYLAGQPDVVSQMGALIRVIKERANGLQPLLQLKGKLDMLSAQLDLRRDVQEQNAEDGSDEDGAVTVYQEGQEDEVSDDEAMDSEDDGQLRDRKSKGAFTSGIVMQDDSEEEAGSSSEEEALFDDEAEETEDDGDDSEEEESDEEEMD